MGATGTARKTKTRRAGRKAAPRRRKRLSWVVRGVAACAALVLGLIAWAAIARALAPAANTVQERFDALIVLGSPADADGNPAPEQLARVTEAVHEYERGVAPRVIVTGGATRKGFVEARVMARTAEAQGVPAEAVFEEPEARNTIENTCDSLKIMRRHGWKSAEVVSSASHLPRAGLILSRLPLKWRTHAAPALEPEGAGQSAARTALEILKTMRYLVWARQVEPCRL